jgi:hypothetical protein
MILFEADRGPTARGVEEIYGLAGRRRALVAAGVLRLHAIHS